ncbi:helix-turn-helix transcriptional regulator [Serratia fonticola]|uniref:helix-turn-helix transcriptional regulator n=1 Tax=Serratia fonticola TaxID=47917 RepID=UPI0015C5FFBE|nr:LuxR C-terminal-related transcriptional regulator [Serratia fonticola]MBC3381124.1 helix-turn-helix transcriptional regulator [Serratia fonticola]NYA40323.1 helix-turn-helix transcriptional regulator [Serratia fonticola]
MTSLLTQETKPRQTVALVHQCSFTRLGLKALLSPIYNVIDAENINDIEQKIRALSSLDLLLLSPQPFPPDRRKEVGQFMKMIYRLHPQCMVLLTLETTDMSYIRYLLGLFKIVGGFDLSHSVSALCLHIEAILSGDEVPSLPFDWQALSSREYAVLSALVSGKQPVQVGKALGVHVKTVSHYKRQGLKKLGVRNMQTFLLSPYPNLMAFS